MRNINNGFGVRTTTEIKGKTIPKKIPKKKVVGGKRKNIFGFQ